MAIDNLSPVPKPGDRAPPSPQIPFPSPKPVLLVFLRAVGDPFAEKTFNLLTSLSTQHPHLQCIAVSHSPRPLAEQWIVDIGGEWEVEMVFDTERELYRQWGLGEGSTWYTMNPWTMWSMYRLGKDEGIWGTEEKGGSKWQMGGAFAVDAGGFVRWAKVCESADDIPDLEEGVRVLETSKTKTGLA
ncbi:hypothetical protein OQA88_526 [Cercophora sp. LCS_1]